MEESHADALLASVHEVLGEARHLQTVGTGESSCIEHVSIQ